MPWPLYLALKHLFPTGRWVSFFTVVSVIGVTLGVMVLIVVQSVMNGFAHEYQVNLIRAQGHLTIRSGGLMDNADELVRLALTAPGVVSAEPYALGMVMLQYQNRPMFPAVRSVTWPPQYPLTEEEREFGATADTAFPNVRSFDVNQPGSENHPLAETILFGGSFADLDDNSVLLGRGLAADLGVSVGETVEIYSPLMVDRAKHDELLMPIPLRVAGLFETGWTVADNTTIAVTLRRMQELYGLEGEVHGIEIRLASDDLGRTLDAAAFLNEQLAPLNEARAARGEARPLRARTWLEVNHDLMQILWVEKTVMLYLMIFIVVVASFSIASSLVTAVVRKTREIGVLRAMGARPGQIAAVYCLQGLLIGVAGVAFGVAGALLLLYYRQPIIEQFVDPRLLVQFYKFLSFPVEYRTADFVKIISFTLLITTAAGLLPAWRAGRLKPADCLRNE